MARDLGKTFDQLLRQAVELGEYPPSGRGMGTEVMAALRKVADDYPETKPETIRAARNAFQEWNDFLTT